MEVSEESKNTKKVKLLYFSIAVVIFCMFRDYTATVPLKPRIFVTKMIFTEKNIINKTKDCYHLEDSDAIDEVYSVLKTSRRTFQSSVSFEPLKNDYIVVQIIDQRGSGGVIRSIYEEGEKSFIDHPFEILYELPKDSVKKIKEIYSSKGYKF